jgi:nucleotide-binding universal stress UspA family protein
MFDARRPILLPFDGSAPARAAASHARVLAHATGAPVHLVYVLPSTNLLADLGIGPAAGRDARELLEEIADTFPSRANVQLLEGDPADAVAEEARRVDAGLVLVGAKGRSMLAGLLLGSTPRRLLQRCELPVLVAHEPVDGLRHLVACVEEGEAALRVVRAAGAVGAATRAAITLVHVVDAAEEVAAAPEKFGIPEDRWRAALQAHLDRVFGPLRALAPGAQELIRYGRPERCLRDAAEATGADVLVVARKGRSGVDVDEWSSVATSLAVRGPFATLVV